METICQDQLQKFNSEEHQTIKNALCQKKNEFQLQIRQEKISKMQDDKRIMCRHSQLQEQQEKGIIDQSPHIADQINAKICKMLNSIANQIYSSQANQLLNYQQINEEIKNCKQQQDIFNQQFHGKVKDQIIISKFLTFFSANNGQNLQLLMKLIQLDSSNEMFCQIKLEALTIMTNILAIDTNDKDISEFLLQNGFVNILMHQISLLVDPKPEKNTDFNNEIQYQSANEHVIQNLQDEILCQLIWCMTNFLASPSQSIFQCFIDQSDYLRLLKQLTDNVVLYDITEQNSIISNLVWNIYVLTRRGLLFNLSYEQMESLIPFLIDLLVLLHFQQEHLLHATLQCLKNMQVLFNKQQQYLNMEQYRTYCHDAALLSKRLIQLLEHNNSNIVILSLAVICAILQNDQIEYSSCVELALTMIQENLLDNLCRCLQQKNPPTIRFYAVQVLANLVVFNASENTIVQEQTTQSNQNNFVQTDDNINIMGIEDSQESIQKECQIIQIIQNNNLNRVEPSAQLIIQEVIQSNCLKEIILLIQVDTYKIVKECMYVIHNLITEMDGLTPQHEGDKLLHTFVSTQLIIESLVGQIKTCFENDKALLQQILEDLHVLFDRERKCQQQNQCQTSIQTFERMGGPVLLESVLESNEIQPQDLNYIQISEQILEEFCHCDAFEFRELNH